MNFTFYKNAVCLIVSLSVVNFTYAQRQPKQPDAQTQRYLDKADAFTKKPLFNLDSTRFYYKKAEAHLLKTNSKGYYNLARINSEAATLMWRFQYFNEIKPYAAKAAAYLKKSTFEDLILEFNINFAISIAEVFDGNTQRGIRLFAQSEASLQNAGSDYVNNPVFLAQKGYLYTMYSPNVNQNEESIYLESLKGFEKNNLPEDHYLIAKVHGGLSIFYAVQTGKGELERKHLDLAEKFAILAKDPYYEQFSTITNAEIQISEKNTDAGFQLLNSALDSLKKYHLENSNFGAYVLGSLGDHELQRNNYERALSMYTQAYTIADQLNYKDDAIFNLKKIGEAYHKKGDYQSAYDYQQRYLNDFVKIEEDRYEKRLEEYELEIDLLNKDRQLTDADTSRKQLIIGLIIALVFLTVTLLLIRRQRNLNGLLKTRNVEKDVLLKEVHHRVKNNLTVIVSLLELQIHQTDNQPAIDILIDSQNKVKSIALIHQKLYQDDNLASVDLGTFITELYAQIRNTMSVTKTKIEFINTINVLDLDIDTIVPLGLICNELITNSLKHAFANQKEGMISVETTSAGNGVFTLHYRDSGPGLPGGKLTVEIENMGLRLVRRLTQQLDGKLSYTKEKGITTFSVLFKNRRNR